MFANVKRAPLLIRRPAILVALTLLITLLGLPWAPIGNAASAMTRTGVGAKPTPAIDQPHPTAAEAARASGCPAYQIFGGRGSGEKVGDGGGYGVTVDAVRQTILAKRSGGRSNYIDYPAIAVQWWNP
jgi:hypothetical protein